MSVRDIVLWPDPRLSHVCAPALLDDPDLPPLIADLFDTMYAARGRGLAAPQIGVMRRVFVVDVTWKEAARTPMAFINPVVRTAPGAGRHIADEQCLSIPDLPMPVERPDLVEVRFVTPDGQDVTARYTGNEARCIQHEMDHLEGRVIFDHQPPDRRARLEAAYGG